MFEKYNIDNLFVGEVSGIMPNSIVNNGGCYSIDGIYYGTYNTILYFDGSDYIDIYHPKSIINVIETPSRRHLEISKNKILYTLNTSSLKKYREAFHINAGKAKVLQRLPFKKKRLLEK